ncbi:hypothetical protein [Actinophytocola sp. NPDC049390]|uniref:hypothetical protein n=1 Tax=Actinophytocola sp. NPDC049390 TaxID=3363894 RepID=UPI00379C41CB
MSSLDERQALTLGSLILLGLVTLTAAVPVVGYVLLGLVILSVLGLVAGAVVLWRKTRWQPLDDRPMRVATPVTQNREVA